MSTSYRVDAVPAKLNTDRSISLNIADYQCPIGMSSLLDNRHIPPSKKPPAGYHRAANRLRNWYNGKEELVIIYSRYQLDKLAYVVTDVHRVDAAQRCR